MKKPLLQDDAFLADVMAQRGEDGLHLWWLGQSGFLLLWQGQCLLLDPYLSDSLTHKYAHTAIPHVRLTERVVAPEKLGFVSIVTSSHNHTDHLDGETLRPLMAANSALTVIVPAANQLFAANRLQVEPEQLTAVTTHTPLTLPPWTFHAVPAAHETITRDENGQPHCIGLLIQVGRWTIYHSGDTMYDQAVVSSLRPFTIDLALLPINGRDPARGVAGNLSGPEAVQLAQECAIGHIIPCHFDMFAFNTASPDPFLAAARAANQPYHLLQNGQRLTLR